ncbi:hypothetical protein BDB01DRAFT_847010 [Pilobolus umbonatus]|nr:hypothetical protein BDB01DRAFT_847010 [Pilobolus umbonatus]
MGNNVSVDRVSEIQKAIKHHPATTSHQITTHSVLENNSFIHKKSFQFSSISERVRGKLPSIIHSTSSANRSICNGSKSETKQIQKLYNKKNVESTHYGLASGVSSKDTAQFSRLADSSFTEITNISQLSIQSFMEPSKEDNGYIMILPEFDNSTGPSHVKSFNSMASSQLSIDNVFSKDSILQLLMTRPKETFDIFNEIITSSRMRSNKDFQKEVFHAAEVWRTRSNDASAKIAVARCKLCGWGTPIQPLQGFLELEALANEGVWQAYFYLGQCYYLGVEQHTTAEGVSTVIQSVDNNKASYWLRRVYTVPSHITSKYVPGFIAQAQLNVAMIYFTTTENFYDEIHEYIDLIRKSALVGNKISEFLMGLFLEYGISKESIAPKEYYSRSAKKLFTPAMIHLAMILLMENNSIEGVSLLKKASLLNNINATYQLGLIYELGVSVDINYEIAFSNYHHAADKHNHSLSQFRLGIHYLYGTLGQKEDIEKANAYLHQSAMSGYANAQYTLGILYCEGKIAVSSSGSGRTLNNTAEKQRKKAFSWFRKAAAQKHPQAITQMGKCYEQGIGIPINIDKAIESYEQAIRMKAKSLPSAQLTYATFLHKEKRYKEALQLYLKASGLDTKCRNPFPSSVIVARAASLSVALIYLDNKDPCIPYKPKEAFDILSALVQSGPEDASAHYWLALAHKEGIPGVCSIDVIKAYSLYQTAARLNHADSQFEIGLMLSKGIGVKEDRTAAFSWFKKASNLNHANALYYVGIYFYNGTEDIKQDRDEARQYFGKAAALGVTDAMALYAQSCQEKCKEIRRKITSSTIPAKQKQEIQNLQTMSFEWYKQAATLGHVKACRELGRLHAYGSYANKQNYVLAVKYYQLAANKQDALATLFLGGLYENGHGVDLDTDKALVYYRKAFQLGQSSALYIIAELYEKLNQYEDAYHYYHCVTKEPKLSSSKYRPMSLLKIVIYNLRYRPSQLVNEDYVGYEAAQRLPEAIKLQPSISATKSFQLLYDLATKDHLNEAFIWIAECYLDGNGVPRDAALSLKWRNKAAENGEIKAIMQLMYKFQHGVGVDRDPDLSYRYCLMMDGSNNAKRQYRLGLSFWRGIDNRSINLGIAAVWFGLSANQNYGPSYWALGQMAMENGDVHVAKYWWELAMPLGSPPREPELQINKVLLSVDTAESISMADLFISIGHSFIEESIAGSDLKESEDNHLSDSSSQKRVIALSCYEQAAQLGHVNGMYLVGQEWHRLNEYSAALDYYEQAAQCDHIPSKIMCAVYQLYGLAGLVQDEEAGYQKLLVLSKLESTGYLYIGKCHEYGLGTKKNESEALTWYHLSIELTDSSEAMFCVGQVYEKKGNESRSFYWYKRAIAKNNHIKAHIRLGVYYQHEKRKEDDKILFHLNKGVEEQDVEAMYELGRYLLSDSSQNKKAGIEWLEKAAKEGSREALRELGRLYHFNQCEDVAQDFAKSYYYYNAAAKLGDKTSALYLGILYENGLHVPRNIEMAKSCYALAMELGSQDSLCFSDLPLSHIERSSVWWSAQLYLARIYHQNAETQADAYSLFLSVHSHIEESNRACVEVMLAQYELYGWGGISKQEEKAFQTLLTLAEQGHVKAFFHVAFCYALGLGVQSSGIKALHWLVALVHSPVADPDTLDEDDLKNLACAYYQLAEYYRIGDVVPIDMEKSHLLYKIAAERGSKQAQQYLSLSK